MIDFLYEPDARDRNIFGDNYTPPVRFNHGQDYVVARFPAKYDDGHDVEISECRLPARFFTLRDLKTGHTITTGSGDEVGKLIVQIAKALTEGMLGIHDAKN